ncbi:MAG: dienelactone hydrolase family protein [Pseudomonadales bacterium]|nr:dienelactone hydrolase family protein [Pseudomonadales bacterium]
MTGIVEHLLDVTSEGRRVPTVLFTPVGADGPSRLVLVGHGGGGHKRAPTVMKMAEGLAAEHGIATLAIDGPVNGDRTANDETAAQLRRDDRQAYRRRYYMEKYDEMVADWRAALDVALARSDILGGPVGYWGLSMGTRFGVPLVAAEPRIRVAVLGLFGYREGVDTNQRVYDDIGKVDVPVLFLQQLEDDEVSPGAYHELFKRIGTRDRRLHANPGRHAEVPRSELIASRLFLARKLGATSDD